MTAIPRRVETDGRGAQLFAAAKCAVCHAPTLKTRADYPIALLAAVDAPDDGGGDEQAATRADTSDAAAVER
jgi:mono/diheme cytochrome c family protein